MALAPKAGQKRAASDQGGKRSSVASASGKAAQRARNGSHMGSSGTGIRLRDFPQVDWDELVDAVHLTDIAGKISHTQVGSAGTVTATLNVPVSYLHALLDAHVQSRDAMIYIRVYHVPMEAFLSRMADEGAGDEDAGTVDIGLSGTD